jgi:hypothetical protein
MGSDNLSFELMSADDKKVTIKLRSPLNEMLSDIVEVYGEVNDKCEIACVNYATFEPKAISNFGS